MDALGRRLGPASVERDGDVKLLSGTKETSVFLPDIQSSLLWFWSLDLQVDTVS